LKLATARIWCTESAVLVPHSDEPFSLMRPDTTIVFSGAVEIRSGDVWLAAGCLFSSC
jgi:hypothetical protein